MKQEIIKAFKRHLCRTMGETSSSQIATQTLPIAWDIAVALNYNPVQFCRSIGYSYAMLARLNYIPAEDVEWDMEEL